ncbi:MAG: hypothetical protein IT437_00565 [Phycisphaerales bacterium]|nr:hypothetical protein [Phycisphaerales bacterium]
MRHSTQRPWALAPVDPRVRRMFERVLASWAGDVLVLRRRGLDRPGVWTAEREPAIRRAA